MIAVTGDERVVQIKDGEGHGVAGRRRERKGSGLALAIAGHFLRPWNCGTITVRYQFGQAAMIDAQGFRPNVGIVIANDDGRLLWARRVGGRDAWQFPQGGHAGGRKARGRLVP
jgi:hypothetical protein